MPSYQDKDPHYKDNMAQWPSYHYNGNLYASNGSLYIETGRNGHKTKLSL